MNILLCYDAMLCIRVGPFSKAYFAHLLFKDLILLILMVCFFLHITYTNRNLYLVEFSFL